MRLNIENWLKLRSFVQKEGQFANSNAFFEMSQWIERNASIDDWIEGYYDGGCGTAACLAGSTLLACVGKSARANPGSIAKAADLLGLPHDDSLLTSKYFSPGMELWPRWIVKKYRDAKNPLERSKAATAFIDHMICEELLRLDKSNDPEDHQYLERLRELEVEDE